MPAQPLDGPADRRDEILYFIVTDPDGPVWKQAVA
jgi:hypothetical protein